MSSLAAFTVEEVAKHNKEEDCWVIIDNKVYDVTNFLQDHPGGRNVLLRVGGKDATKQFQMFHNAAVLPNYGGDLLIGQIGDQKQMDASEKRKTAFQIIEQMGGFGALIPYGDPNWYFGFNSAYYNESHRRLRAACREWCDTNIIPYVHQWDEAKQLPKEIFEKAADAGLMGVAGGIPWPTKYAGNKIIGGLKPEEFDWFHRLIIIDELCRSGSGGLAWGLMGGTLIGIPPILHFGSEYVKNKVCGPCLTGKKVLCLAVTEPWAGSDVANLRTTAQKTEDGRFYIVNGEKKWITNGTFADFFTVAVRTGGPGATGVSLLLIERSMPGVKTTQMNCSGVWSSGTAYVSFSNVKVPVENIIGKENQGFKAIMYNFNSERWSIAAQANRFARVCIEDAIMHAIKRKTFGKPLIQHQVIRHKLAEMASKVEATHAWLETLTHQLNTMDTKTANMQLGGHLALLKAQTSRNLEFCVREAQQIFGGLGYTRGGLGGRVERLSREVRAFAVPAGSEEIMLDLATKQAERQANAIRKSIKKITNSKL